MASDLHWDSCLSLPSAWIGAMCHRAIFETRLYVVRAGLNSQGSFRVALNYIHAIAGELQWF